MLQIKNLTVTHTKDLRKITDNFSFTLHDGDKAAVIGEEGNGKSTLLKLIYDPSLVSGYCEYSGEIIKSGRVGYLPQELTNEQKSMSAYEFFCGIEGFYDLFPAELSKISLALCMPNDIFYSEQCLNSMSGGEKVKLQLAALMISHPDILLMDEPSNDLDTGALEELEKFINSYDSPIIYVSHDETLLENTANVIIHLEQVRRKTNSKYTISRSGYREYTEQRAAGIAHSEQIARKEQAEYEKQQEKFRRIQSRVEHEQNVISRYDPHGGRLLKKKMAAVKSMEHRFEREHENAAQMPETEDEIFVCFSPDITSPKGKTILDLNLDVLQNESGILARDINIHVNGGEKLCIVGHNGAGKTTLLRQIAKQLLPRTDIKAAYMPQDYTECMDFSLTPVEYLSRIGTKDEITAIKTYLGSMRYTPDEMNHKIAELSGGQKAKLYFIAMNLDKCDVLILDEPTRNFSPLSGPVIRHALIEYGGTIISVSHDRKYISEVCDRIIEM